jgi:hypothetical protein
MHKGFKFLGVSTGRIYISLDVIFDEQVFPFADLHANAGAPLRSEIELFLLLFFMLLLFLGVLRYLLLMWLIVHLTLLLTLVKIWRKIKLQHQYHMMFHRGRQACGSKTI